MLPKTQRNYARLFVCFALLSLAASLKAQPTDDPLVQMVESLKPNVVAIRAVFAEGEEELGFGFVTGEKDGRLFLATTAHVVRGHENDQNATSIEVSFFGEMDWIKAKFKRHWDEEDLALLEITKPEGFKWRADCADLAPQILQKVRFIGRHADRKGPQWVYPGTGEVFELEDQQINFSINTILPGTSGAPLIGEKGILGLITDDDAATALALPLSRIKTLFSGGGQYPYFGLQAIGSVAKPPPQTNTQPTTPQEASPDEYGLLRITGGTFTMGCQDAQRDGDCEDYEKPATQVTVPDFWIGQYEVTQAQWRAIMGSDPLNLYNIGCDQCPVEGVSWNEIQGFIQKLNDKTGKKYRLPTEAEWEYAARGGQAGKQHNYLYSGSNNIDEVAWYRDNYSKDNTSGAQKSTHPVGGKKANELGLYDMSGNVWEWVEDDYHNSYTGRPTNGSAWVNNQRDSRRVIRGGSWSRNAAVVRVANRSNNFESESRLGNVGFRLARAVR